jgi:hypothetical protein
MTTRSGGIVGEAMISSGRVTPSGPAMVGVAGVDGAMGVAGN